MIRLVWPIVLIVAVAAAIAGLAGAALGFGGVLIVAPLVALAALAAGFWTSRRYAEPLARVAEAGRTAATTDATGAAELAMAIASEFRDTVAKLRDLSEEAERRQAALQRTDDGVVLMDRTAVIDYANPAARGLLGGSISDSNHRLRSADIERLLARAAADGVPVVEEVTIRTPAPRRVLARVVPLPGSGHALLLKDLSESMRLDRVRRDFVANVSHELKTPVAAVQALAEVAASALSDGDMEAVARFVERLHADAARLAGLVSDLLDLSRVEAGGEIDPATVDLRRLAESAADRVRSIAELKGLAVEVSGASVLIEADAAQLDMAVRNLVDNAVRYSDSGRVRIEVGVTGNMAQIAVTDEGVGIPSDHLERIFERFYRVDKARSRATGGTGLGLAIVRHVAENHGGRVEVHSELGRGSTFRLQLPRAGGRTTTGTAA